LRAHGAVPRHHLLALSRLSADRVQRRAGRILPDADLLAEKQILADYHFVVDYNPFASLLSVVSSPILGKVPTTFEYAMCLLMALAVGIVAVPFFARYRARIVYWL
jgi:hypothetical protein